MPNTLMDLMPKILSQALITLRENAVMPRLVNSDYSTDAAKQGNVIHVPVPSKMQTQDVIPGPYSQNTPDLQIDTVPIPLNNWKEVAFGLSDKETLEIMDGAVNMQIVEAARAIANDVDRSLIGLYKNVYNYSGTAGTTPFATDLSAALSARKLLNANNALLSDRRIVLGVEAEGNAFGLAAFQNYVDKSIDGTFQTGQIGSRIGFDWYLDQNMPQHTKGSIAGSLTVAGPAQSVATPDASNPQYHNPRTINTVVINGGTAGQTLVAGDVFSVAGDSQTYVVLNDATVLAGTPTTATVSFSPAPKVAWSASAVVTVRASHAVNLAFHRDSFALAVRPLEQSQYDRELGGNTMTMVDPLTGIPLRLEVRREHKRVRYSLDCLWGVGAPRAETAIRLVG